ncbi:MAG: hypothetical protein AVO33_08435 [delta proteobacterium ML8_F1]|nr:MAG: hypothetical protein AVO33_08435 [delta proteobacterium ML8_F1]
MIVRKIINAAMPYLKERTIADVVVGISLVAVRLDNGAVGVTYVLREELGQGCSIFPYVGQLVGQRAATVAQWTAGEEDSLKRSLGLAVLLGASMGQSLEDSETAGQPFGVDFQAGDLVGMVGYIRPVEKMIRPRVRDFFIFDQGIELRGDLGEVRPMEEQATLLPQCDVVFLSGTTVLNGTLESLLEMCSGAREIILIGASTPMYPEAFKDTRVTVLAGSWWKPDRWEGIARKISRAGGIAHLRDDVIKKSLRIAKKAP